MKTLFFLWHRELLQIKHDPRRIFFLLVAGLAYLILFGILFSPNIVTDVPVVIADEDQSALSRELVRDFESSDSYRIVAYTDSIPELKQMVRDKEAIAGIAIPEDFSKKVKTGSSQNVLVLVDGTNIIPTGAVTGAAQDILAVFSNQVAARQTALRHNANEQALMTSIAPVSVHLRVLDNPTQGYLYFYLLGLGIAAFQQGIIFAIGGAACYENEHLEESTNYAPWQLLLSKTLFYWGLALFAYIMVLLFELYVWQIPLRGSFRDIFLLTAVYMLSMIAFTFCFAYPFHREFDFLRYSILYPVPAFIISGFTWPVAGMSPAMQMVAQFFPMTYMSNTMREIFLMGKSPHFWTSMAHLSFLFALFGLLALILYTYRSKKWRKTVKA